MPFSAADAHDALGDVIATVGLYRAIVAAAGTIPTSDVDQTTSVSVAGLAWIMW